MSTVPQGYLLPRTFFPSPFSITAITTVNVISSCCCLPTSFPAVVIVVVVYQRHSQLLLLFTNVISSCCCCLPTSFPVVVDFSRLFEVGFFVLYLFTFFFIFTCAGSFRYWPIRQLVLKLMDACPEAAPYTSIGDFFIENSDEAPWFTLYSLVNTVNSMVYTMLIG